MGPSSADEGPEEDFWQGILTLLGLMIIYAEGPDAPSTTEGDELAFRIELRPDGAVSVNGLSADF